MLSSSVFSSFNCPDNECARPYCQYIHEKKYGKLRFVVLPAATLKYNLFDFILIFSDTSPQKSISTDSVPSTSSSVIVISQEEAPILNDYVGYYSSDNATNPSPSTSLSTITTTATMNQAYNPFSIGYGYNYNSATSYAPEAPTTSFNNTNPYIPEFNAYKSTTTETYNYSGGFAADDEDEVMDPKPSNISPHKSKKGQGFALHDEVMDPSPSKKPKIRKDSSEFVDPSKPVLPPDLSQDEILQFGKHLKEKPRGLLILL